MESTMANTNSTTCISGGGGAVTGSSVYIDLERPDAVYSGGNTLKGVVRLELTRPVDILCVELRVYGGAFVKWSERDDEEQIEVEHTAEEIYFNDSFILWGQGRAPASSETLEAGRHLLPFNVYLQPGIPSSYEGPCGWVRYQVNAHLRGLHEDLSVRADTYFAVVRDLDLSTVVPDKEAPLGQDREFLLHASCCKAGRVDASLRLGTTCYVPGQRIHADMDIANLSPRRAKTTALALRQVVRYGSTSDKSHQVTIELRRISGDALKPGKRQCWTTRAIEIPAVTPSGLEGCKFIDIRYEVALLIDMSGRVLCLSQPITIGSIPSSPSAVSPPVYKAQFLPPNQRIRWDLTPDGPQPQRPGDNQDDFSPRYKLYTFHTCISKIIQLQQSPHARRRRYLVLGDNTIQESTI